ncbi:hypothetical protein [Nostocoides sp. Soil756]|jgi:uncharacterized cupredoxin-like copper-binding protein|uniref:hypothetical protein n=1 Tax=Nostocoides sp. Soil756 TaxID=1736399 RepID=UPI00070184DD|nr:hypothetical protein [Tetrasphaera sp. Soil756]KRE60678.1 hypothetical protein ASG78_14240 [Tetrasphaera sp. Soil756]
MTTSRSPHRRTLAVLAASTALLLSGCGSADIGGGMMGGGDGSPGGMLRGDGRYHDARLSCPAPATLPGSTVRVSLMDMGMMQATDGVARLGAPMRLVASSRSVPAGTVSLVAENRGWRTHELVVLPLPDGAAAGRRVPGPDGRVPEEGSVGEASASCAAGTGEGIASGAVGWVTLPLAPGRYELVCNLENHYANGMYQELDVR